MANKITFVHAPNIQYEQNYGVTLTPLWAYTLASHLPDGWRVEVFNTQIDGAPHSLGAADVFAFSGMNKDIETVRVAHDILQKKYPDAIFIVGGPMTWSMDKEGKISLLEYFDHIFILDGEHTLPEFLNKVVAGDEAKVEKIIRAERFPIGQAKEIDFELFRPVAPKYYGAMVEVSRGCPFLCEFCDVRVLPGNNRANNKDPRIIVNELDEYYQMGIKQFQFVCDNFIGDIKWATECIDAILEWQERTGAKISVFTWLTINLYKMPELMAKMRQAGFSIFNIGIESVNSNALLETAKIQNVKVELETAVTEIQSYGFVIIPGFIFGFDSDTPEVFKDTLNFMANSGLIGGEPAFLIALSGTPLFSRMKRSGRLIEESEDDVVKRKGNIGLETYVESNIRYLLDADVLGDGFFAFMQTYMSADWQFARYKKHLEVIGETGKYVQPPDAGGYGSRAEYIKRQFGDRVALWMLVKRISWILLRPSVFLGLLKARSLTKKYEKKYGDLGFHFNYWAYVWTNMGMKYSALKRQHIHLESVGADFDFENFAPSLGHQLTADEKLRGDEKVEQQARYTNKALAAIAAAHGKAEPAPKTGDDETAQA